MRRFQLMPPHLPEHDIQKVVARVLMLEIAPAGKISPDGVCWFSISQENYAGEVPGIRVGRGLVAGVFDMLFLYAGKTFWLELKSRDGVMSDPQRSMAATLLLSGCRIGVARDAGEVLRCLDEWGIPRKQRIHDHG